MHCVKTIAQAIAEANVGGRTAVAQGVAVQSSSTEGMQAALDLVQAADIAVLVLGNDRSIERETRDRPDITLSGLQGPFAEKVLALGKPTLLILSNGGILAIDDLIEPSAAIVEAFNPAFQASALAALLFGRENRWGKLPVTMYPQSYTKEQPMDNYDMAAAPGRTYKYYQGKALFEFGHGLSLTSFAVECSRQGGTALLFLCRVRNTGGLDGDEVVMAFHSAGQDIRAAAKHPVPAKALIGFERVSIPAGGEVSVAFPLDQEALMLVNEKGDKVLYGGDRTILFSNGAGQTSEIPIRVDAAMEAGGDAAGAKLFL